MNGSEWESQPQRSRVLPLLIGLAAAVAIGVLSRGATAPSRPVIDPPSATPTEVSTAASDWTALPQAPIGGRQGHTLVWTGDELIAWGGVRGENDSAQSRAANDGAAYDPVTRRWRTLPPGPGQGRFMHTAAWAGRELLIWGGATPHGAARPSGVAYDPAQDQWRTLLPSPLGPRVLPASVWTGSRFIVWGGSFRHALADGAAYDPRHDRWERLPQAPLEPRDGASAVWTGEEVIIWGGRDRRETLFVAGAAYHPQRGTWRTLPRGPADIRARHVAVWTGEEMIVWGGQGRDYSNSSSGFAYSPERDAWRRLAPAPIDVHSATGAWTGRHVVIAGTSASLGEVQVAAYHPASDRWTTVSAPPTADGLAAPVVWTGRHVLLWGGLTQPGGAALPGEHLR